MTEKLELKVQESSFLLPQDGDVDVGAKYLLDHPEHADYSQEEARKE